MSDYISRLRNERRNALAAAEQILANAQGHTLTESEEHDYQRKIEAIEAIDFRRAKYEDDERAAQAAEESLRSIMNGPRLRGSAYVTPEDRELDTWLRQTIRNQSREPLELQIPQSELRSGYQPGIEMRDQLTTSGGGLLGTSFHGSIQRHMVANSAILSAGATVLTTPTGEPLKVPKSTAFSAATITAEAGTITESDPTLGSVALGSWKYGFLVQVSYELAEDANFDLLSFLAEQAGTAVANGFGAHAISGTGTGQPRGILTDASLGVTGPTGTATSFGSGATVGQGGDLFIDLMASVASPYARSASAAWLMRNSTLAAVRKLRDSQGRYIFTSDIPYGSGAAGTLLGRPVFVDESMPAMGANAKSVLFGDISRYWVRSVGTLRFQRSDDYAFANDLATFRCLARLDGALVDTTGAVKYLQHSAT